MMTNTPKALAAALAHHQAGRLSEAEQVYRRILDAEPNLADAWHLLGAVTFQAGNSAVAIPYLQRSLLLQPNNAEALNTLGLILDQQGQRDEAVRCFAQSIDLAPAYAEAHYNMGNAFESGRQLDDAIACYRKALAVNPTFIEAHNNLGNVFKKQGQLENAIICYRRVIELEPALAEAHYNLGLVFHEQRKIDEAIACYSRAVEVKPNYPEANCSLGNAFREKGLLEQAASCYRRAVELNPRLVEGHGMLGLVFDQLGKQSEAISSLRSALTLNPNYVEAYNNLGNALRDQREFDEAAACYQRALELAPNNATVHCNRACLRLLQGDFEHGWSEYEWRWKTGELAERNFPPPRWNGELLTNKVILLHAEQGLGDTIQFIRYAAIVKELGGTVLVQCPRRLLNVLASCSGIDRLISYGDTSPPFDFHAPLLSVPAILKTSPRNIPSTVPYLSADANLVAEWARRLDSIHGFRIGINWHGRTGNTNSQKRDIPRDLFASLAQLPSVRLISLQKKSGQDVALALEEFPVVDLGPDVDVSHGAFMDTAAIIANLDLVISSDTSIPHLAGALSAPVWLALTHVPDWRWLLDRSDSPWYPTMRLFRQKNSGDWASVFEEMQKELKRMLEASL